VWRDPDVFLRWDFLPKVLKLVPVECAMADARRRPAFLALCDGLVAWTMERLEPSWREDAGGRDRNRAELFEWRYGLYGFLAKVALHMEAEEAQRRFLEPAFALEDELAASLVRPFANMLACAIMDLPSVEARTIGLLEACTRRVLGDKTWDETRHRRGELYGFDLPDLVRILLFVQVEHADFANGDWREVASVLPVVDPFVRAVGDVPAVASSFLTLCERALDHYPAELFVEQVTVVLANQIGTPIGWRGSTIPGRIAALLQEFAQRAQPLSTTLAQGMLRVLDRLVDMGDRRCAALQASELFRNQVASSARSR
jgi:hypothetical protein